MGHKIHPKCFRLITTQKHISQWYSKKINYKDFIYIDTKLRYNIEKLFNNLLLLSDIVILRKFTSNNMIQYNHIIITLFSPEKQEIAKFLRKIAHINIKLDPIDVKYDNKLSFDSEIIVDQERFNKAQEINNELYKAFRHTLTIKINTLIKNLIIKSKINQFYIVSVNLKNRLFSSANFLAKYISLQLKRKVAYNRIINDLALDQRLNDQIKGIKVQISGRLNGKDKASSIWQRRGSLPLHTLHAYIDYCSTASETTHGSLGVKVWLHL